MKKHFGDNVETNLKFINPAESNGIAAIWFSRDQTVGNCGFKNTSKGVRLVLAMILEDVARKKQGVVKAMPSFKERVELVKSFGSDLRQTSYQHLIASSAANQIPVQDTVISKRKAGVHLYYTEYVNQIPRLCRIP
jgi:hypothetical protein